MKVFVLGHNGMLGTTVNSYLERYYEVETTDYRYPSTEFVDTLCNFDGNWVINCIGAIPHKYLEFNVNYELPMFLDSLNTFKIIHCSTDDEKSDTPYSNSKRRAYDWLYSESKNTYSIKSSIIGVGGYGILSWLLSNNSVNGYSNCMWNGITTLEWAKRCRLIIDGIVDKKFQSFTTNCISKFDLLKIISKIYNHNVEIRDDNSIFINNCIDGVYVGNIENQLIEFKEFNENLLFNNDVL